MANLFAEQVSGLRPQIPNYREATVDEKLRLTILVPRLNGPTAQRAAPFSGNSMTSEIEGNKLYVLTSWLKFFLNKEKNPILRFILIRTKK